MGIILGVVFWVGKKNLVDSIIEIILGDGVKEEMSVVEVVFNFMYFLVYISFVKIFSFIEFKLVKRGWDVLGLRLGKKVCGFF